MSQPPNEYRAWERSCRDEAARAQTYTAREVFERAADDDVHTPIAIRCCGNVDKRCKTAAREQGRVCLGPPPGRRHSATPCSRRLGEGDLLRADHFVSPDRLGSKASVLMRRLRQSGFSTLIISTANSAHSSQMEACGVATSTITSLFIFPQNEQADVVTMVILLRWLMRDHGGG